MASPARNYPNQIDAEAAEVKKSREAMLQIMQIKLNNMKYRVETLSRSNNDGTSKSQIKQIELCMRDVKASSKEITEEMKLLKQKMERAPEFERANYKRAADEWFQKASTVLTTSHKNKLYLGNRQYVTAHASSSRDKQQRYLNAGIWSWGVNLGWIEGGISAGVVFKIKFHPNDDFAGFPAGSLEKIEADPYMSGDAWLALCEQHPGSMLWQDGEGRATWFAMEVKAALDARYHFVFGTKKSGDTKLMLET